ncbi:MAG: phosphate ABC transporter permease, partial [Gammaproteobacteria bacterium]
MPVRLRWRLLKDAGARLGVGLGGISVIIAIALIFFYLLTMVLPLFKAPSMAQVAAYPLPGASRDGRTVHLVLDEQLEIGVRYTAAGRVVFFHPGDGKVLAVRQLVPEAYGVPVSFSAGDDEGKMVAYGLADGRAILAKLVFDVSYPGDVRQITPRIEYPLGESPQVVDLAGRPLLKLAVQGDEEATTIAAVVPGGELVLSAFTAEESLLGDEVEVEAEYSTLPLADIHMDYLLLDKMQRMLYVASREGTLAVIERDVDGELAILQRLQLLGNGASLSALEFLTGDISLLVGDSHGRITQWFPVQDEANRPVLTRIRSFSAGSAVRAIASEQRRKGFLAATADGRVGLYHTTAERTLLEVPVVAGQALKQVAMAPRANAMLTEDGAGALHFWAIENEHPEISWSSLWGKVWYESYPEPAYIWQSSSASNDFEPKFSLTPLTFGTIKAAFYAMLCAIPLGVMGAIYTAYFMAPRMRQLVKPSIEIMEALPTVILGFLAGLWLAPLLEANLTGVFAVILLLPPGVLLFAWLWQRLPAGLRQRIPEGWDAALLVPVILLIAVLAWLAGPPIEHWLFGGNLPGWLNHELGIDFDQRNSLVVGLAMG